MLDRIANIRGSVKKVTPFRVMSIVQRASELEDQGRKIVHMEVGEPDFSTAAPIINAAKKALDEGLTQYTAASGIPQLRECLVGYYREKYGVEISSDRILIRQVRAVG